METFRAAGVPVSRGAAAGVLGETLSRLVEAAAWSACRRLIILGDLVHARAGTTAEVLERFSAVREGALAKVECAIVPGNHDRDVDELSKRWRLGVLDEGHVEGPFAFVHDPGAALEERGSGVFTWAGHIHPVVRLRGGGQSLRLACFHVGGRVGILPAFSAFTGGAVVEGDGRAFAIAEGTVVEV